MIIAYHLPKSSEMNLHVWSDSAPSSPRETVKPLRLFIDGAIRRYFFLISRLLYGKLPLCHRTDGILRGNPREEKGQKKVLALTLSNVYNEPRYNFGVFLKKPLVHSLWITC